MRKHLLLIGIMLIVSTFCGGSVVDRIDWKEFLSRHDLVWDQMPVDYFEAPFVGNGLLGALLYKPDNNPLRLDIGSMDVVEHRKNKEISSVVNNGRLPVGFFELATSYKIRKTTGRLDLYNAETSFSLETDSGYKIDLKLKVLREVDVIVLEYTRSPELNCYWIFRPLPSSVPRLPVKGGAWLNPPAEENIKNGVRVVTQKRDAGGSYSTAWKEIPLGGNRYRLLITIQDTYPDDMSSQKAVDIINQYQKKEEFTQQQEQHKMWWNAYYKASFISIPHPQMESLYWGLQYKLGSMIRKGGPICDLMGPWYKETRWPGVWLNLNTQMLFSSLHISNQLELISNLTDFVFSNEQKFINSIPEQYRHNAAGIPRCIGKDLIDDVLGMPNAEYPERSNFLYLMYHMWEHYRVTMDDHYLKEQYYPLLKRAVNFLINVLEEDEKGLLHTPKSHSPEAISDVDTNYDLASLRWGCQTLLTIDKRLQTNDKERKIWTDVLKRLVPYPTDENGYRASVNYGPPLRHRHWCHLFQIYPYYNVNFDQLENRDLILRSIRYWGDPTIPNTWTQAAISSMYSSVQDGNSALMHMNLALKTSNLSKNFMHSEGKNPCSETYGGLSRMLLDMLIQSWGGKIRIFPGVSEEWQESVFH
ncbi:hypothetical protein LJC38_06720, partial [Parabacteroides sp. OttesenSCG-928-K15]|nr:hypothetical protein [Parabacteroides sp. OttesenSCG-928-K15]